MLSKCEHCKLHKQTEQLEQIINEIEALLPNTTQLWLDKVKQLIKQAKEV
jgi:hypothetical protein